MALLMMMMIPIRNASINNVCIVLLNPVNALTSNPSTSILTNAICWYSNHDENDDEDNGDHDTLDRWYKHLSAVDTVTV